MKTLFFTLTLFLLAFFAKAQCNLNVQSWNNCTDSIQMYTTGGTAPYSYTISPIAGIPTSYGFYQVPAGIYTITASDVNGCTGTVVDTVFNLTPITATSTIIPSCTNSCNGQISLNVTGGIPPYSYYYILNNQWIQSPSSTISNLCAGNITVYIYDASNCSTPFSNTYTIGNSTSNLSITTNITQPTCSTANGNVTLQASGGTAPYSYSIYNNGNLIGTNSTGIFNSLPVGYYSILYSDSITANCPAFDSIYIYSSTQNLYLTKNITQANCNNPLGSVVLTATGGIAPYTYSLLQSGNVIASNNTGIFNNLPIGFYNIQYNDVNSVLCPSSDTLNINNPNSAAYLYLWSQNDTCGNTPLPNGAFIDCYMINTNSTFSYSINPISGTQNGSLFLGLANGVYTITATDSLTGCTFTNTQTINSIGQIPGASVSAVIVSQSCYGTNDGSIDLTITGGPALLNYNWNNNATTQDISNLSSGAYSCVITDPITGNCLTFSDSINTSGINCGYLEGIVFDDDNNNCIKDASENYLSNILITLSNGQIGYTNMNGFYSISNIPYGTYGITQTLPNSIGANSCTQPTSVILSATNSYLTTIDFKDTTATVCNEAITAWSDSQFLPGGVGTYHIRYFKSNNNNSSTGTISFVLPAGLSYNTATVAPSAIFSSPNGDSLVWNNVNVTYATQHIYVYCNIPTTMTLGTSITSHAHIVATNCVDNYLYNNNYNWTRQISAAYDPNEKTVSPFGTGANGGITTYENKLDYLIKFQNVGNAAAQNVVILDTISQYLDINTLHVTSFSHDYTVSVLNGNVLKFTFANIQLPDSNSNEPGSHGFIAYDIKQKANNPVGTVINNTASIYFDYNSAVVTNTTVNTIIATPQNVNQTLLNDNSINIYPSPAKDYINIAFEKAEQSDTKVSIINNLGSVVFESIIEKNQLTKTIHLDNLTSGLYFIKLSNDEGSFNKKIFISK